MPNIPPPRSFFSRQRTPILIVLGGGLFIGLKWRAVMQRSEEAKRASAKGSYHVDAGERSGKWWDLDDDVHDDDESNNGLDDDNVYYIHEEDADGGLHTSIAYRMAQHMQM
ncbi:hypothetical protein HYFRA_00004592 [Hymenoscyphus fraxineus]|uniref:Uncharacterized protein n=1 Tax=Hymenoscyphus fraxineus TaxID=746836 RepID=A0A9N9KUT8_9HELO|nr:hypothetical protein HYFRA_00004592 [Hymenoscyphus fraxineus]